VTTHIPRSTAGPPHQIPPAGERNWTGLLAEIGARLQAMSEAARERGDKLLPPLLILGTSERVGSNWISDTLRPALGQHNEPFRQQLAPSHPLSPLNPRPASLTGNDPLAVGNLGWHWLVSFAVSKYAATRQAVKETNVFFALPALLDLLPGAPAVVLSRSPLGVASSFMRGRLFTRWGYRARYQQMIALTSDQNSHTCRFARLVPDDDPPDLVALTRLQVLNTVLLAEALRDRDTTHISYETAVIAPGEAQAALAAVVPELARPCLRVSRATDSPRTAGSGDSTFVTTNSKTSLTAWLGPQDAELVRAATAASLAAAQTVVPGQVAAKAAAWLAGDHLYRLQASPPPPAVPSPHRPEPGRPVPVHYVRRDGMEVRNLLVSNAEFARFLNAMAEAGMPNSHGGTYLLACEMPHERGGRLHQDKPAGSWDVSTGFDDHPAYWVTWIGAAAFAAWTGARLPARDEILSLTASATVSNAGYQSGDVTPVSEPGRGADEIHHLLGNLQVWCSDGPSAPDCLDGPAARWLSGVAWNTPATRKEARRLRHRHILGCSRGIGIRLIRDGTSRPVPISDLAARLTGWITSLPGRSRRLAEIEQPLIRALDASQADVRLSTHIAASGGESRHG
jgi:formylglycine-generating enzyme required for sulfatase activity